MNRDGRGQAPATSISLYPLLIRWLLRKMIGQICHGNAALSIERHLEPQRRLIVEQILPPVRGHEFGQHHRHYGTGVGPLYSTLISR